MLNRIQRFTKLTLLEQALLLQLSLLAFGLKTALAMLPIPRLTSLLSRAGSSHWFNRIPLFHSRCTLDQLLRLIDLATTVSHGESRCLPRSLLLFWLLCARREPGDLCLGVSTSLNKLDGHAWVEQGGIVVGDTRTFTDRYTPFLRFPA